MEESVYGSSIRVVGSVEDVNAYYSKAEIFVLPSRYEGLSNSLLEAMSWGVPPVVSDISANTSVVEHMVTGLITPVEDARSLGKAILMLVKDPELRRQLGIAARRKIEQAYSIDYVAQRYREQYESLDDRRITATPELGDSD